MLKKQVIITTIWSLMTLGIPYIVIVVWDSIPHFVLPCHMMRRNFQKSCIYEKTKYIGKLYNILYKHKSKL